MLRGRFGLKRDEVAGEWRKLHNEKLYALYTSPNIIQVINPYPANVENMVSS